MFYKAPNALLPYLVCSAIWDPFRSCLGWSWCGPHVPLSTGTTLVRARMPSIARSPPVPSRLSGTRGSPLGWKVPLISTGDHRGPWPQPCCGIHASTAPAPPARHTPPAATGLPGMAKMWSERVCPESPLRSGVLANRVQEQAAWRRWLGRKAPTPVCFHLSARLRALTLQGHRRTSTPLWTFRLSFPKSGWQCLQPKNKPPLPLGALRFILFKLHTLFSFLGV